MQTHPPANEKQNLYSPAYIRENQSFICTFFKQLSGDWYAVNCCKILSNFIEWLKRSTLKSNCSDH